jgi:hypothetical protein
MTKKIYTVNFTFKADHREDCPFYEWATSFSPKKKEMVQVSYCRIFGHEHKCSALTLGDTGFPKWCPLTFEEIEE